MSYFDFNTVPLSNGALFYRDFAESFLGGDDVDARWEALFHDFLACECENLHSFIRDIDFRALYSWKFRYGKYPIAAHVIIVMVRTSL